MTLGSTQRKTQTPKTRTNRVSIQERIEADLREAMRGGRVLERDTLRMVLADLKNQRIREGRDLKEAEELVIVARAVKTRKESARLFGDAGRLELAEKELAEIAVVETYLPQQLGEDEVRGIISAVIKEEGLSSKQDLGHLMKVLMSRHRGEIDGGSARALAAEMLA